MSIIPEDPYYEQANPIMKALLWVSLLYALSVVGVELHKLGVI